jgi:hypothetical protein
MELRAGIGLLGRGAGFGSSGNGIWQKYPERHPDKKQVGFLPFFAYSIRAWVQSKNAARQKSTGINGARSCV